MGDGEAWDDGGAGTGADEPVDRPVVVRPEDDGRVDAARTKARLELVRIAAVPDQRQRGEFAKRDALTPPRERRFRLDDHDERIPQQLDRLERPVAERERREREIELAALEQREQLAVRGRFVQAHAHPRPSTQECPHELGENARADALVRPDVQRPGRSLGERGEIRPRRSEARHDALGVAEEELARFRERHRLWPARPLDEASPGDVL